MVAYLRSRCFLDGSACVQVVDPFSAFHFPVFIISSTVVPAYDLLSETWKGVYRGRATPPLASAPQQRLVVPFGQCSRSPQGTAMSRTERKQAVIPRYCMFADVVATLHLIMHSRAMSA